MSNTKPRTGCAPAAAGRPDEAASRFIGTQASAGRVERENNCGFMSIYPLAALREKGFVATQMIAGGRDPRRCAGLRERRGLRVKPRGPSVEAAAVRRSSRSGRLAAKARNAVGPGRFGEGNDASRAVLPFQEASRGRTHGDRILSIPSERQSRADRPTQGQFAACTRFNEAMRWRKAGCWSSRSAILCQSSSGPRAS